MNDFFDGLPANLVIRIQYKKDDGVEELVQVRVDHSEGLSRRWGKKYANSCLVEGKGTFYINVIKLALIVDGVIRAVEPGPRDYMISKIMAVTVLPEDNANISDVGNPG